MAQYDLLQLLLRQLLLAWLPVQQPHKLTHVQEPKPAKYRRTLFRFHFIQVASADIWKPTALGLIFYVALHILLHVIYLIELRRCMQIVDTSKDTVNL